MRATLSVLTYLIIWFNLVPFRCVVGASTATADNPPLKPALCELFAHPGKYSGKDLMVSARITQTKDGSDIWDPGCPNSGAILRTNPSSESDPTVVELYRTLRLHGLSDHPVTAILFGVLRDEPYEQIPGRGRLIFVVTAASGISQTKHIERRKFKPPS